MQAAIQAFEQKDYKTAAQLWLNNISLNTPDAELKQIHVLCKKAETEGVNNEWIYISIAGTYLDAGELFMNREDTLLETISYAKKAIALNPNIYEAHRFAGSACYWLGDYSAAKKHYQNAINILPDMVLAQRINDCNQQLGEPLTPIEIKINFESTDAKYFYEQGVGLAKMKDSPIEGLDARQISDLAMKCYERCYELYTAKLTPPTPDADGNLYPNDEQHRLAMCCNNLSILYNDKKLHNEALNVINVGFTYSVFEYLYHNLMYTYNYLKQHKETAEIANLLIENYELEDTVYFFCLDRICYHQVKNSNYNDCIATADAAIEQYLKLSLESQIEATIVENYANIYNNKIASQQALGINVSGEISDEPIHNALLETPDNIRLIISGGVMYMQQQQYNDAYQAYSTALQMSIEKNDVEMQTEALLKRGYLQLYYMGNTQAALQDFDEAEKSGGKKFITHYYQMNCYYNLNQSKEVLQLFHTSKTYIDGTIENDKDTMSQYYMMAGDSYFDEAQYNQAVECYNHSLSYKYIEGVKTNLDLAQQQMNANKSSGFFKKLFG